MLTAQDHRTQPFGGEYLRLARKISGDQQRQSEEVRETQHIEVGLVDRIDRLDHPFRHQRFQERAVPGHDDQERKTNPGNRHRLRRRGTGSMNCSLATPPTPHHAAKKNINCQANGLKYQCVPGGYEAKFQSNKRAPMYRRTEAKQGPVRAAHHTPQDQRCSGHQRYIERQHVEVDRLVAQRERLSDQNVRVLRENCEH